MIRWEDQKSGDWDGYSGEVIVATARRDPTESGRWNWEVTGAGNAKGMRSAGHRTNEVDARRSAEGAWQKWLDATALKPDLMTLAEMSLPKKRRPKDGADLKAEAPSPGAGSSAGLEQLRSRAELAEARLNEAQEHVAAAEARAASAEAKAAEIETASRSRLDRIREVLDEDEHRDPVPR
jgi:hypothetical protein